MSKAAQSTVPGPGLPHPDARPVRLELAGAEGSRGLGPEPRRALAVLRAANLLGDAGATRALLRWSGVDGDGKNVVAIREADCERLASRLRQKGYPLSDDGLKTFKLERGLSGEIRVGPEVALAFARFAAGRDVRVSISPEEWSRLDLEGQRALKLLALMAEGPNELNAVARALGAEVNATIDEPAVLDGALATRLVEWAHQSGLSLTNEGLVRLAGVLGWPAALVDGRLARFITDAVLTRGEPVHDYSRLTCQGCTLNGRTVSMLSAAESHLDGLPLKVVKGSYDVREHKGAHPHIGGGVADLSVKGLETAQIERFVAALRRVGFAAWFRPREDRPHVHAVAIGDREMAPAAQWQVRQYFMGRDGRTRLGADPHGGPPRDLPSWVLRHRLAAI